MRSWLGCRRVPPASPSLHRPARHTPVPRASRAEFLLDPCLQRPNLQHSFRASCNFAINRLLHGDSACGRSRRSARSHRVAAGRALLPWEARAHVSRCLCLIQGCDADNPPCRPKGARPRKAPLFLVAESITPPNRQKAPRTHLFLEPPLVVFSFHNTPSSNTYSTTIS